MNSEGDIFEQAKTFLPKYLTPQEARDLYSELKRFPDVTSFYLDREDLSNELLQGDGWHGFVVLNFNTGERKTVSGLIISNSCDIDPQNTSNAHAKILFAPLIGIDRYAAVLNGAGNSNEQVENILRETRRQRVTTVFFLPAHREVLQESVIFLDDIHAHPLANFLQRERSFLVRLNQVFFYIFLIKLSIHFSRFNEGVHRSSRASKAS